VQGGGKKKVALRWKGKATVQTAASSHLLNVIAGQRTGFVEQDVQLARKHFTFCGANTLQIRDPQGRLTVNVGHKTRAKAKEGKE
jgi:hypothetical protein